MAEHEPTTEQIAVINHPGNLVTIARPGSGKTFVLTKKIQKILADHPLFRGVIAISYTNKASDELRQRVLKSGADSKGSFFGTIDKFCWSEIVIPFIPHLWGPPDEPATIHRIKDLEGTDKEPFADVEEDAFTVADVDTHLEILKSWQKKGCLFLETSCALAVYTLTKSAAARRYVAARYSHIIIDEYQDSGQQQHELLHLIRGLGLVAVAVGDADQSIYGFSNKDAKFLLSLAEHPDFQLFPITRNHRSHSSIINYSLRFLDANAAQIHTDENRMFLKICNGTHEAIANWIDAQLPAIMAQYGITKRSDIAVLVSSNASGQRINKALVTPHRFLHTHPLEEHFSPWARLFADSLSFRFNTSVTAEEIIEGSNSRLTPEESRQARKLIKALRQTPDENLYDALEGVATLLLPKARKQEAIDLMRATSPDAYAAHFCRGEEHEVQVLSLHKSKGSEFEVVFHLDLYTWTLPQLQPGPNNDWTRPVYRNLAQDRNLHYVGVTRARKACFLCTSTYRVTASGGTSQAQPSEFLSANNLSLIRQLSPY
jgi:superfamily I DNA/RNA helicase